MLKRQDFEMRVTSRLVIGLLSLYALRGTADAATFLYASNAGGSGNVVFAYSVNSDGSLTLIDTFPTGGLGSVGLFAANRIVAVPSRQLLYVANDASSTISAFSIAPETGRLKLLTDPFEIAGAASGDMSLDATPDGAFLFASNSVTNTIVTFSIAPDGTLTQITTTPGIGVGVNGLRVSPNGKFLAHAATFSNTVATYLVNSDGTLTPVSQLTAGGDGKVASVAFNSQSTLLFGGEAVNTGTTVAAFTVSPTGGLAVVPGSPFSGPGDNSNVALVSPDDHFVFVSNQFSDSVTVFSVGSNGTLTVVPGSPFSEFNGQTPAGMVVNSTGTFLYTANVPNTIGGFAINANGTLTLLFVISAGAASGLEALAIVTLADATTTTSLTSSPKTSEFGQNVKLTATVKTSSGTPVTSGTVTFKDGGIVIAGPLVLDGAGSVTFSTSSLSVAPQHSITAEYSGALGFAPSVGALTQVVQKAGTSTALASSPNPSVTGQPVTFTATVTTATGRVMAGSVTFKESATVLGGPFPLNNLGEATLTSSTLSVGAHAITAEYSGSGNFNPSIGAVTQTVTTVTTPASLVDHPPVADAGAPQTVRPLSTVTLDGSASRDRDGDRITFTWTQVQGPAVALANATSATPSFTAPSVATTTRLTFRLIVADASSTSAPADVTITVVNGAPACESAHATPDLLWPPDRRLVPVAILGVTDPDNDRVNIRITGVTQDDPVRRGGDHDRRDHGDRRRGRDRGRDHHDGGRDDDDRDAAAPAPDAVVLGDKVLLRADRVNRNGRVYMVSFSADDGDGGTCAGTVRVTVPRKLGVPGRRNH